jgi:hypothetical protein
MDMMRSLIFNSFCISSILPPVRVLESLAF